MRFLPVTVTIDPFVPESDEIVSYLTAIARRLDEKPEPMRVVFDSPKGVFLDSDREGRVVVRVVMANGVSECSVDLRGRWICEYPLPLPLPAMLDFLPVDANRFRVKISPLFARVLHSLKKIKDKIND